jgi:hypothetical protein
LKGAFRKSGTSARKRKLEKMHKQASAESREGGDRDRDMRMKTEKKKKEKVCGVQVSLGYYLASHLSHFGIGRLPNS